MQGKLLKNYCIPSISVSFAYRFIVLKLEHAPFRHYISVTAFDVWRTAVHQLFTKKEEPL